MAIVLSLTFQTGHLSCQSPEPTRREAAECRPEASVRRAEKRSIENKMISTYYIWYIHESRLQVEVQ